MTQAIVKRVTLKCDCHANGEHGEGLAYFDAESQLLLVVRRQNGVNHVLAFTKQRIDKLFSGQSQSIDT